MSLESLQESLQALYQELIIDHGTQPRNFRVLTDATQTAVGCNPLCGDKIQVYLKSDQETIEIGTFSGIGCAICIASASLLTEALVGKTFAEALQLSTRFKTALTLCPSSNDPCDNCPLGKLSALLGVQAFPARIKCATLPWHTLDAALKRSDNPPTPSTEPASL